MSKLSRLRAIFVWYLSAYIINTSVWFSNVFTENVNRRLVNRNIPSKY